MTTAIELTRWWSTEKERFAKPWLVLGKGPSLSDFDPNQTAYHTFGLNHVVKLYHVDIAHAIDIEVVVECEDALDEHCKFLLMPYTPNVQFQSSGYSIEHFFADIPVLKKLADQKRLVWYNLENGPMNRFHPSIRSPKITAKYFSVEAAIDILGTLGVRDLRSYGIDGGTSYSPNVMSTSAKNLLANGQPSFDLQFPCIQSILEKHSMSYTPLSRPCRIYVGTDDSQMVAAKVLEHSIVKHAKRPVQVIHMLNLEYPAVTNPKIRVGTGFSFARFKIPELAGYEGKCMYVDADMQVFSDITSLWERDMGAAKVSCTRQDYIPDVWKDNPAFSAGRQMSVLMLDCSQLRWRVDEIISNLNSDLFSYKQLMTELCILKPDEIDDTLPPSWNCLEHFEPGETNLLHYTNVPTQPWKSRENPLADIWEESFKEALQSGVLTLELVTKAVIEGHIRSDLLGTAIEITTSNTVECDSATSMFRNLLYQAIKDKETAKLSLERVTEELARTKKKLTAYESFLPLRAAIKLKSLLKSKTT